MQKLGAQKFSILSDTDKRQPIWGSAQGCVMRVPPARPGYVNVLLVASRGRVGRATCAAAATGYPFGPLATRLPGHWGVVAPIASGKMPRPNTPLVARTRSHGPHLLR